MIDKKPNTEKIKTKKLPRNFVSLAEKQENRINGNDQGYISRKFFNSKHSVLDFYCVAGIYKLLQEGVIVYIGESEDMLRRISQHLNGKFIFDEFILKEFKGSAKQRKAKEASLIRQFKPKYNTVHKEPKKRDALDCRHIGLS